MKTFQWKHAAVVCALVCTPICAQATTISFTDWTTPGIVTFSSDGPPSPYTVLEDLLGPEPEPELLFFNWYCDPELFGDLECSGTNSSPNMVEYRTTFDLPADPALIGHAYIDIAADDYFALYVNGNLLTPNGVWLDDTGDRATRYDLKNSLVFGGGNEILIFACDGYPKSSGAKPGVTPAGGWDGCEPTDRVNNWLLTDGWIERLEGSGGDAYYVSFGGPWDYPGSSWQVRGATIIPEPGAVSLMLIGAIGGLLLQGKRKQRKQK